MNPRLNKRIIGAIHNTTSAMVEKKEKVDKMNPSLAALSLLNKRHVLMSLPS